MGPKGRAPKEDRKEWRGSALGELQVGVPHHSLECALLVCGPLNHTLS